MIGVEPPVTHVTSPITAVLLVYTTAFLSCFILYKLAEFLVPNVIKIYVLDFIKTMAFISYGFGHGLNRKYYGNFGYFLCAVPLNTITTLALTSGEGNPLGNWKSLLRGQRSFPEFVLRLFCQILSTIGAWQLGLFIYRLDFYWHLPYRAAELPGECVMKDFLNVPFYVGFLLEMTGVTYDHWVGSQPLSKYRPVDVFLKFVNTASVVCLGK